MKPALHEIVDYFEGPARGSSMAEKIWGHGEYAANYDQMWVHMLHAFGAVFDHAGDFRLKFNPYFTDRDLADIGTGPDQRGTEEQIRVAHFLFDEKGSLRHWLDEPLKTLLHTMAPALTSDIAILHFGNKMDSITSSQYSAVYAWKK